MTRDVLVSIRGMDGGANEEDIETIHCGQFFKKNDKVYIKYEESIDDAGSRISTTIKVSGTEVQVINKGAINSNMVFISGRKITNNYVSPYGVLNMGVDTECLLIRETENTYDVELKYNIEYDGSYASSRHVLINVREQGNEVHLVEE